MPYSYREDFPPKPSSDKDFLYQTFNLEEWGRSNFASKEELQWFQDARYGMFIHFGLSAYRNEDLSWGVCYSRKAPDVGHGPYPDEEWTQWYKEFSLEHFDANEWVEIARASGFKYIVLIAKHHDGFHMWDTAESDFKITNTPFGRDLVKEVVDACHQADMPIGLYYSQRDWVHPDYMPVDPEKVEKQEGVNWTLKPGVKNPIGERHRKYLEYQERAIRELCTQYGKIDIFWWDAAWWGGMFTADMWDAERITRLIRELQPGIILNNRCSVPGDFDTPEKRLGAFQNWRPWESCVCLTDTWSYSGTDVKSMKDMVEMLTATVCGDGNLLISWGARWSGAFAAAETERLKEFGVWVKAHELALFGTRGGPWKPGRWGGSVYRESTVYLHITHLSGDALELPALPDCTVLSARIFNTEHDVAVDASVNLVRLQIPAEIQADLDTIIELTLDTPAENIQAVESCKASPFADVYAYGHEVESDVSIRSSSVEGGGSGAEGDLPLRTNVESSPWIEFDLGSGLNVTGIVLNLNDAAGNNADLHLYTSGDCGEWEDFGKLDAAENNVEITSYVAGAWIPGRTVRYVKVQSVSRQPTALDLLEFVCFAKGGKK